MDVRVSWSPAALDDVDAITEYIYCDSPAYTSAVVSKLLEAARNLATFPNAGRIVPELDDDTIRERFILQLPAHLSHPGQRNPRRCRRSRPAAPGAVARPDQRRLILSC
ncbi:type II toxin-antitoxin system RelE/ParE family toxin [Woeseia oceani]|uniref:type II toxin-antitoxin system RelE/ParE family toxin n=1 Tax=Woeseia oceani TaxID=1548547 RepID=UPI002029DAD4|nr:type II toxin-antitoxin system RelE/ParE family toxin [Woeseia oceani]